MTKSTIGRVLAVIAVATAATLGGVTTASAAPVNPNGSGAVRQAALPENSVYHAQINDQVEADLMKTPALSVWTTSINKWAVTEDKLAPSVADKLNSKAGVGWAVDIPAKAINKIGGPFATNATVLGTFELPPVGLYQVTTQAVFDRVDATHADYITPTTETMPSLVLRFTTDSGGVGDAGTIMGAQISKAGFVELTGSSVASVRPGASPMTVTVYGFGYNEDRGNFGSVDATPGAKAQFTAGAKIVIDQIG
jgi:hypothetical protein